MIVGTFLPTCVCGVEPSAQVLKVSNDHFSFRFAAARRRDPIDQAVHLVPVAHANRLAAR